MTEVVSPQPTARSTRSQLSYAAVGCAKWDALLAVHDVNPARRRLLNHDLQELMYPWGELPIGDEPRYFSLASNDGMPIEVSGAWSRNKFEARVYVEPMASDAAQSLRAAAIMSTSRLGALNGVCLDRYWRLEDLLLGLASEQPTFWVGNAIMVDDSPGLIGKAYLNPQTAGRHKTAEVLREAMRRLGMARAWRTVVERPAAAGLGQPELEPIFLTLDLLDHEKARVKVYFRHSATPPDELDDWTRVAADFEPGLSTHIHDLVTRPGRYGTKPLITSFTFVAGLDAPASTTLYLPLDPNLPNDVVARERVLRVFADQEIEPDRYIASLDALADRPLASSRMQTYLGYRGGADPRISVFFATQAYTFPG